MPASSRSDRLRAVVFAAAMSVCLIAARPPQMVGDAGEYLVYALNFASLRGPSLKTVHLDELKQQVVDYAPELDAPDFYRNAVPGRGGRRDFMHFWAFSLAATPYVWLAKAVGLPPVYAFFGLNLTVLLIAVWVALPRIGAAWTLFLFASPLLWWIDKAHTEMCTVSLIALALLLLREKPWWSMVAIGLASTQYPPLVVGVPLVAVVSVIRPRRSFSVDRDKMTSEVFLRRFQLGLIAGLLLAVLHPAYYYVRHGTPSLLLNVSNTGTPTWAELSTVILDPNLGLFANFPVWPVAAVTALALVIRNRPRDLVAADAICAFILSAFLIAVFARKDNVHHGATPSLSRYALWFIPMVVPLLRAMVDLGERLWRVFAWTAAAISAGISVFAFHPSVPQNSREPTWIANYLWTRHPAWNNPLPEVFAESFSRADEPYAPTSTNGCEKILLGGMTADGAWPIPCYPANLPLNCRTEAHWCYANRVANDYAIARAPGRWNPRPQTRPGTSWPPDTEPAVRDLYQEWAWWTLRPNVPLWFLRQSTGVHVIALEGPDRFILVLRGAQPGATLAFRLPGPMTGRIVDAHGGRVLANVQFTGAAWERWEVPIPAGTDLMLLAMRR